MRKIKDRRTLRIVAGILGALPKIIIDEILRLDISKRSYRQTAAGVWVNSRKEAESWKGSILGTIMDKTSIMLEAFLARGLGMLKIGFSLLHHLLNPLNKGFYVIKGKCRLHI